MSIIHKALKKADSDSSSDGHTSIKSSARVSASASPQSMARLMWIFGTFFALLAVAYFGPDYYKAYKIKMAKQKAAQSIQIGSTQPDATPIAGEMKKLAPLTSDELSGGATELSKKGVEQYRAKNYERAYEYFMAALKQEKNNHVAYNNLGLTLKKQKMYKGAFESYRAALAIKKDYKECYNNLGVLYDNLGSYEDAITNFKMAIKLDSDYQDSYFNIAVTYEKMKKYKLANIYYLDYLKRYDGKDIGFVDMLKRKTEIISQLR